MRTSQKDSIQSGNGQFCQKYNIQMELRGGGLAEHFYMGTRDKGGGWIHGRYS